MAMPEDTRGHGPTHDQIVEYAGTIRNLCAPEVREILSFDAGHIITNYTKQSMAVASETAGGRLDDTGSSHYGSRYASSQGSIGDTLL